MRSHSAHFYSDSLQIDAKFHLPDSPQPPAGYALIVACSGFLGLQNIHPERFARTFTEYGYACFSFDYRGYGASAGQRNRVIVEEQVRDIRNGVSYAIQKDGVDATKVFLLGWAMGGGLVVDAARELANLRGLVVVNGLFDGLLFQQSHRNPQELDSFRRAITEERAERSVGRPARQVNPFDIYPMDDQTTEYVRSRLDSVPGYESGACSFEFAESLLRWSVLPLAGRVDAPLFLAHGTENRLHLPEQAHRLAETYAGEVTSYWLPGVGHTEWMHDDDPNYIALCNRVLKWLDEHQAA